MIRLRNTRSFRNPHRKKSGTVISGDRTGYAMSPKLRTQVTRCCTFQRSIASDHMKWRPLLYRSPSRQPRQAIVLAQYSNLKCASRLRATCIYIYIYIYSDKYITNSATCFGSNEPSSGQIWKNSPGTSRECTQCALSGCNKLCLRLHKFWF